MNTKKKINLLAVQIRIIKINEIWRRVNNHERNKFERVSVIAWLDLMSTNKTSNLTVRIELSKPSLKYGDASIFDSKREIRHVS